MAGPWLWNCGKELWKIFVAKPTDSESVIAKGYPNNQKIFPSPEKILAILHISKSFTIIFAILGNCSWTRSPNCFRNQGRGGGVAQALDTNIQINGLMDIFCLN